MVNSYGRYEVSAFIHNVTSDQEVQSKYNIPEHLTFQQQRSESLAMWFIMYACALAILFDYIQISINLKMLANF